MGLTPSLAAPNGSAQILLEPNCPRGGSNPLVSAHAWTPALLFFLVACRSGGHGPAHADGSGDAGSGSGSGTASSGPGDESGTEETGTGDGHFDLPAPGTVNDGNFATASVCAECHANADGANAMRTAQDEPIAPYDLWQGTMMANAARDPVWWAAVRAEVAATPARQAEIEAECTRCHAPMAAIRNDLYDDVDGSLAMLLADDERAQLGLDGVACAACHQIGTGDLGTEASYSGHPELTTVGLVYGPHTNPFTMPMQHRTGFTPTYESTVEDAMDLGLAL